MKLEDHALNGERPFIVVLPNVQEDGKFPFGIGLFVRVMIFDGDPADMALALLLSIETKSRKKGFFQEKSM
jgi:hypothetical protein